MGFKSIIGATCACLAAVSFNVSAALVSVDWKTAGDNLITRDTVSGLEWLDVTVTAGRSVDDIESNLGVSGELEGWDYATATQAWGLLDGACSYISGVSCNTLSIESRIDEKYFSFVYLQSFWGVTAALGSGNNIYNVTMFYTSEVSPVNEQRRYFGRIEAESFEIADGVYFNNSYYRVNWLASLTSSTDPEIGSALVRPSTVPLPAAVWLFGSGIIGLIGLARRKGNV